jgi:hypothetical protein
VIAPGGRLRLAAVALAVVLVSAAVSAGAGAGAAQAARLAPPADLACPRDSLTLLAGEVLAYRRRATGTRITLRTDWDSRETIELPAASLPGRVKGRPAAEGDLARIERGPRAAQPGLRVRVWLCEDGRTPPVVDWQPAGAAR